MGFAQVKDIKNFSFYAQKDGLSNYNIHKIVQDNQNFLWIATQDGLNRFDGSHFILYNKGLDEKHSLLSNDIRNLIYDSSRNLLWIVCNQGGINAIDIVTGSVTSSVLYNNRSPDSYWSTCAIALKQYIYISTTGGLEMFDTQTRRFVQRKTLLSPFPSGLLNCDIRTLAMDDNQNLWLGLKDKGIVIYNPVADTIIKFIPAAGLIDTQTRNTFWPLTSAIVNHNRYWLGTQYGVYRLQFTPGYQVSLLPIRNTPLEPFARTQVNHLAISSDNNVIISGNRLCLYNTRTQQLQEEEPADQNAKKWLTDIVYCFEDRQRNLWLGCKQGLGVLKSTEITFIPVRNSNQLNNRLSHVYNVVAVDTSQVLASTSEGVFLVTNGSNIRTVYQGSLVQNMVRLNKEEIIFSIRNGSILFTNGNLVPLSSRYPEFATYQNVQLNSKAVLHDTLVVLGTESYDGILVWNTRQHRVTNLRQSAPGTAYGLLSNTVNTVFATQNKQVAVLSDNGITLVDVAKGVSRKLVYYSKLTGKPMGVFMDIAQTPGHYWLNAYGEGLLMLDNDFRLQKIFGLKEGISNTGLYKIFNYKDSMLLLTSNNGISVFNIQKQTFKTYFEEDGLQNNTFEEACGDTLNNIIYAGGVEGFVMVHPSHIQASYTPPQLYITGLQIQADDHQQIDTFHLDLPYFEVPSNTLQTNIRFSGISYSNPGRVQYAYRIKETNSDWINLFTQNYISLTGLDHGTYTLQIKACNEDGLYSKVKQLKLLYLPKWYETIWFEILVGISLAALLYGFYRFRLSQVRKQHTIRRNLASDLHDDIGSSLNTIKVFTHLAKRVDDKQTYLDQIELSLTAATIGLRDLIWVLDDSGDTVQSMIDRINKFALPVANANNIAFECTANINGKEQPLSKTEKRNLLLMIKESINNSIKYAECRHIKVVFALDHKKREIFVSDDGKGFDSTQAKEGNGLNNLQHRASQIHYQVTVTSSPGNGTLVKIVKV